MTKDQVERLAARLAKDLGLDDRTKYELGTFVRAFSASTMDDAAIRASAAEVARRPGGGRRAAGGGGGGAGDRRARGRFKASLSPTARAAYEDAQPGTTANGWRCSKGDAEEVAERLEVAERIKILEATGKASDKEQAKVLRQLVAAEAPAHTGDAEA